MQWNDAPYWEALITEDQPNGSYICRREPNTRHSFGVLTFLWSAILHCWIQRLCSTLAQTVEVLVTLQKQDGLLSHWEDKAEHRARTKSCGHQVCKRGSWSPMREEPWTSQRSPAFMKCDVKTMHEESLGLRECGLYQANKTGQMFHILSHRGISRVLQF